MSINEQYHAAVAPYVLPSGEVDATSNVGDHVLLVLARTKGSREIESCFALCEAMACEIRHPREAVQYYRRAFRLWPELDSPLCSDSVPRKLRVEADALLEVLGPRENASILGPVECPGLLKVVEEPKRQPLLQTFDVAGIAQYISTHEMKNVVVMCGAGMSTAAGIPDFSYSREWALRQFAEVLLGTARRHLHP